MHSPATASAAPRPGSRPARVASASYLPEPVDPPVPGACAESHSAGPAGQSQQQERANTPAENNHTASESEAAGRFVCHICLNSPDKPVVTVCGHLHCWGCLYKWLALHRDHVPDFGPRLPGVGHVERVSFERSEDGGQVVCHEWHGDLSVIPMLLRSRIGLAGFRWSDRTVWDLWD